MISWYEFWGIWIQVSRYDNTELQPIIDQFKSVSRRQIRSRLSHPISLYYLLPGDTSQFYRYSGSLTTPKCDEVVTWTVFPMPINLSEYQVWALIKNRIHFIIIDIWTDRWHIPPGQSAAGIKANFNLTLLRIKAIIFRHWCRIRIAIWKNWCYRLSIILSNIGWKFIQMEIVPISVISYAEGNCG